MKILRSYYGNQGSTPGAAIRENEWKLIEWFEDNSLELYNLKDDIGERNNLAKTHPAITTKLHKKLKQWQKEVNAKFPTKNTQPQNQN